MKDFLNRDFDGNELNDENSIRVPKDLLEVLFKSKNIPPSAMTLYIWIMYEKKWKKDEIERYLYWTEHEWSVALKQLDRAIKQTQVKKKIGEFIDWVETAVKCHDENSLKLLAFAVNNFPEEVRNLIKENEESGDNKHGRC